VEPFGIAESLILSKGELRKSKNEEVLSHNMDQQVPLEELCRIPEERIQVCTTSSRQKNAIITGKRQT
jgi:hypothetical protein